jgi:putative DNA primase/helicase
VLLQVGKGANGKTTITYAMQGALGGYFRTISDRAVIADRSQHPTELMDFAGARLAVIEELPEDAVLNMRRVKAITGPEITARYCGQDSASYDTSHAFMINTNTRPVVTETDHGSWRRPILVSYPYRYHEPHKFPADPGPHDRAGEPGLRERLRAGEDGRREAVLAWLVVWAGAWYAGDEGAGRDPMTFGAMPARLEDDKQAWRAAANPLFAFVAEEMTGDTGAHVMSTDLANRFAGRLAEAGHTRWSDRTLAERLPDVCAAIGIKLVKGFTHGDQSRHGKLSRPDTPYLAPVPGNYKSWRGVRFKTAAERVAEDVEAEPPQGSDQPVIGLIGSPGGSYEEAELESGREPDQSDHYSPVTYGPPAAPPPPPVTQSNGHRPGHCTFRLPCPHCGGVTSHRPLARDPEAQPWPAGSIGEQANQRGG